ncbi:TonB-dependent receptor [Belliella sp. DSM 111904]|uniref:TonB-dependent receptor n=1 Tax=Belliella filtrata TaxID=2923435 RepID=A0ABS9V2E3_9BACT|nr:TonB-dependent receptor [Belliella filtrata]MCH7410524.1 TonB-dependent receptor [Belliella filtrata]
MKIIIRRILLLSIFIYGVFVDAYAQNQSIAIEGVIKEAKTGEPVPGATVIEKGTNNGTVTDVDGNFKINVNSSTAILTVSFIGFSQQEVSLNNKSYIEVFLNEDISQLDEVVVVGYGTQKRSDITGSVASVPKDRLSNLPVTDITQAIQGTTAGLQVTQESSVPGSTGGLQIRGVNSINANTSPFLVVDGSPFFGSINDISPTDVESIEILKDASAVAIYGTRGANGVILITTKRGGVATGKPRVNYNAYTGFEGIANVLRPMGPDQYIQKYEDFLIANNLSMTNILPNAAEVENYENGITTDWLDVASQTGRITEHNLSISGGTENVQYFVSGSKVDQEGVVQGYQFGRASFRTNLDAKINNLIKVGTSAFFTDRNSDGGRVNLLLATAMSPYSRPTDDNDNYIIFPMAPEQLFLNPMLGLTVDREDRQKTLSGGAYVDITPDFIPGLTYRLNGNYTYNIDRFAQYTGRQFNDLNGTANVSNTERTNWVLENILTYSKEFNGHRIDFTGLYSAQKVDHFRTTASSRIFTNDALSFYNLGAGSTQQAGSEGNGYTLLSQMARVNYAYQSRYLLTFTGRRDGYSAFGANTSKYGFFPSVAVGWNIHNENFMANASSVGELKLRLSHGQTGNQAIGVNQTATTANTFLLPFNGTPLVGVLYNNLGNANLNWETTTATNLALDFGIVQNRVRGSIEAYKTVTNDILLRRNLPNITGYGNVWTNLGKMQNVGFEFTLNTVNIENQNFSWETSLNYSRYRNEILELYGDGRDDIGNGWFIGQPLRVVFDYEKIGIWQVGEDVANHDPVARPGDLKYRDQNGDGIINAEDRVILGQRDPRWIGGLTNTFRYKNFSLSIFLQAVRGGLKSNTDLSYADEAGRRNIPEDIGYWTPENQDNYWPGLGAFRNYRGYQFAEDYSFLRVKDVRLSYVVPQDFLSRYKIEGLTLYMAGRNLHTFTNWIGWDPEMNFLPRGSGNWTNNYPLVRTVSIGLNLTL